MQNQNWFQVHAVYQIAFVPGHDDKTIILKMFGTKASTHFTKRICRSVVGQSHNGRYQAAAIYREMGLLGTAV